MRSQARTVEEYLSELPEDRRAAITALRELIVDHLPPGYEEAVNWGMLSYQVPLGVYPDTYNKQPLLYAALASQKSHMAVYLTNVYALPELEAKLVEGFEAAGKKLDMGQSCIRFKRLADLPLEVIARAIEATPLDEFVALAKRTHARRAAGKKPSAAAKKPTAKG